MTENQSWNSNLYDSKHTFVSEYGKDLLSLLNPQAGQHILDLGCGTGDLSKEISDKGSTIIGIDESADMIETAKNKYPQIEFHAMNALKMPYEETFDSIFSNAVLHWILSPKELLNSVYISLKSNGKFVAEFGGKNNCEKITNTIIDVIRNFGYTYNMRDFPWYFPSIGEYATLMESVGFEVSFASYFERPTKLDGEDNALKNWISMFGDKLFKDIPLESKSEIINEVVKRLKPQLLVNGQWYADYKRIRVVGIKR